MAPDRATQSSSSASDSGGGSPLSLKRLKAAFAKMLGGSPADQQKSPAKRDACEISPESIVEGILFIGADDGPPPTAEQLAAVMRDVTPDEVQQAVDRLNAGYQRDHAPYRIANRQGGYQLQLLPEMQRIRDKFLGKAKEAKLSPEAMEVLSVIAYRQPVTLERIDRMRGDRSSTLVRSLVRRGLVRLDRGDEPSYQTTDRFLRLFGLGAADQLPRVAEIDD